MYYPTKLRTPGTIEPSTRLRNSPLSKNEAVTTVAKRPAPRLVTNGRRTARDISRRKKRKRGGGSAGKNRGCRGRKRARRRRGAGASSRARSLGIQSINITMEPLCCGGGRAPRLRRGGPQPPASSARSGEKGYPSLSAALVPHLSRPSSAAAATASFGPATLYNHPPPPRARTFVSLARPLQLSLCTPFSAQPPSAFITALLSHLALPPASSLALSFPPPIARLSSIILFHDRSRSPASPNYYPRAYFRLSLALNSPLGSRTPRRL